MHISINLFSFVNQNKQEKTIRKFISTLCCVKAIQALSANDTLHSGLRKLRAEKQPNMNKMLGITPFTFAEDIEKKYAETLRYAAILKQYKPDNSGNVHQLFDYYDLVYTIRRVFKEHMRYPGHLLYSGIQINLPDNRFYAKVQAGQIYIINGHGKKLGHGTTGTVSHVFDLVSQTYFALKFASKGNFIDLQLESANLKTLHKCLKANTDGFQAAPLADFDLPQNDLVGYLGPLYDIDLEKWIEESNPPPQERLAVCKSLMDICMQLFSLGLWHGDVKPRNIMLKNKQPILIDWAGAIPYYEAFACSRTPRFSTALFCSTADIRIIEDQIDSGGDIIKAAKSMELCSFAITFYWILTGKMPNQHDLDIAPLKDYHNDIIFILRNMLTYHPKDRYTAEQAHRAWKSLDEEKGRLRTKKYKLI